MTDETGLAGEPETWRAGTSVQSVFEAFGAAHGTGTPTMPKRALNMDRKEMAEALRELADELEGGQELIAEGVNKELAFWVNDVIGVTLDGTYSDTPVDVADRFRVAYAERKHVPWAVGALFVAVAAWGRQHQVLLDDIDRLRGRPLNA